MNNDAYGLSRSEGTLPHGINLVDATSTLMDPKGNLHATLKAPYWLITMGDGKMGGLHRFHRFEYAGIGAKAPPFGLSSNTTMILHSSNYFVCPCRHGYGCGFLHRRRRGSQPIGETHRYTVQRSTREPQRRMKSFPQALALLLVVVVGVHLMSVADAWTGEIRGRVVCDVCGDSSIGPEDHALEGAEVAILCMTKSGEVVNYQAFTNSKGVYTVAETMPESDRWDSCLARPISSYNGRCKRRGDAHSGVRFSYTRPSGYSHNVKPFLYKPVSAPAYCI